MSLVRARRVSFQFSDAVPVLDGVELVLTPGWTGLVGPNGAGKTTLLRLLAGSLAPTAGTIRREPDDAIVATCPQEVERCTDDVHGFAASEEPLARRLHGRLWLDPKGIRRWETLSPGERKRWQLGAALASEPDVLLLDEPTNHLDADGRDRLLGSLAEFRGVGVVVSHDRALLDALTTVTVRVEGGEARAWAGPYARACAAWESELTARLEARQEAQDRHRRLERRLDDARRNRESAEAARSAGHRMKDRHDSDARTLGAQTKADWAEAAASRKTGILRRATEKSATALESADVAKPLGRSVSAHYDRCPRPLLAARDAAPIVVGGRTLLDPPALTFGRDDRLRVEGANGAGKSTLVAALLASLRVPADRLVVLPQELDPLQGKEILNEVRSLPADERGRVLAVVAALGVDPERLLASRRPSPGEARKLLIARGLGRHAWGLVLDEPTNHLDLPSIERLEAALAAYPGALLLVSHDPALARRCTTRAWRVADGTVTVGTD